jgi:hypothetical protein
MRQEIEVMRVLRVPPLGKLVVEVNEARFETIDEITDANAKRRLLAAIGELIGFAGNYDSLVEAGVAPPLTAAAAAPPPAPAQPAPAQAGDETISPEQARFLAQMEAQRDAIREGSRTTASTTSETGAPLAQTQPDPNRRPPTGQQPSVAAQIDMILQAMKERDPALAARTIRLRHNPAGGLHIEVDGNFYQEPGEIEETAVQRLIQEAVQVWRSG